MMLKFVYDDGGRAAGGREGSAPDCVVRAIAIVTGQGYDEVYRQVAAMIAIDLYRQAVAFGDVEEEEHAFGYGAVEASGDLAPPRPPRDCTTEPAPPRHKGPRLHGCKRLAFDCAVEAVAVAVGVDCVDLHRRASALSLPRKTGGVAPRVVAQAMAAFGLRRVPPAERTRLIKDPSRGNKRSAAGLWPTYSEVADEYPAAVVSTRRHVAAIVHGAVRDTFDERVWSRIDERGMRAIGERKAASIWVPQ